MLQALSVPTQLPIQCVTCHQLIYYLTGEMSQQRNRLYDYIKCGIRELADEEIINKISEFSKHYVLDCTNLWINSEKGNFTKITFNELKQIFSINNINQFSIFRYFILLMGTLNGNITVYLENGEYKSCVVGNVTIDYLSKLSGISERSVIEYNKILEENKLIYIYRQNDFILGEDNSIKQLTNVYGRYKDSEYINMFAINQKRYKESYRYRKNNHEKANTKRKLAQMYQQLLKGKGENYSKNEIKEIYDYVKLENKKYENMYQKNNCEDYLDKIRDVEIFAKYDFLEGE